MKRVRIMNTFRQAIVDDEDYARVKYYRWYFRYSSGLISGRVNGKHTTLGRCVLNPPEGLEADHADMDVFNNLRSNLRIATRSQNMSNKEGRSWTSSEFKGVSWHAANKKWIAQIQIDKQKIYLGSFDNEIEAAQAYDTAAKEHHLEFAWLNFK